MISVSPNSCCGCSACQAICPQKAISMKADALGFLYPQVDMELCVDCGLCDKVCDFRSDSVLEVNVSDIEAYACRNKDKESIAASRSGAVFPLVAQTVLAEGGVVYGAGYSKHFRVSHSRAITQAQVDVFRGSKYSQSDMCGTFQRVKEDLKSGLRVLFSGTPCQVAALKRFLGDKNQDNLILVDIICHGVGSPAIWEDWLCYLERKVGKRLNSVNFRDKKIFGWSGIHKESFVFEDGVTRTFDYVYYSDIHIRKSCNGCPYCTTSRPSDITLGDLWGWKQVCPADFNRDDMGVSLVLCSTDKGRDIFEAISSYLNFVPVELSSCMQPNLCHPTPVNPLRDAFEDDYRSKGFSFVRRRYGLVGLRYQLSRVKNFIIRKLKKS